MPRMQTATQIISHRSEHGRWQVVLREPDPRPCSDVRQYMGYVERTTRFEQRRELPTGDAALIVSFGTPVRVIDPRQPTATTEYARAFVTGPDDVYALTDTGGMWHGVQVSLTPIGAYRLFGLPMDELARRVVELEDLFGAGAARRLTERLGEAPDWESRFRILDIAYACGYYDQAHLIRDCQQFAGAAPGELFRRRLPDRGGVVDS